MKVIVTGGAGFIGSHLVDRLVESGHQVVVIDNLSTGKRANLRRYIQKSPNFRLLEKDLADFESWDRLPAVVRGTELIFHLAALPRIGRSLDNPLLTHQANVNGTVQALELARRLEVKRFIYTSSSSVYGTQPTMPLSEEMIPNPQNPYASQKLIGEVYCDIYAKVYGVQSLVFRLFNVYGERMAAQGAYRLIFDIWMEQKKQARPLTIAGTGRQTRDFTHVEDVINGLVMAMEKPLKSRFEVFNLGSGQQTAIRDLAKLFAHPVVKVAARPNEEMYKVASLEKTTKWLGWQPTRDIKWGVEQLLKEIK